MYKGVRKTEGIIILIYLILFSPLSIAGNLTAETTKEFNLKLIKNIKVDYTIKSLKVSPAAQYVYLMDLEGCKFYIASVSNLSLVKKVKFYETSGIGYNYKHHRKIPSIQEKPVECDISTDGRYVWVSLHNAYSVVVYDTEEMNYNTSNGDYKKVKSINYTNGITNILKLREIKVGRTPKVVKFSPDQKYVYVTNWHSSSVSVIDAVKFKLIKNVKIGPQNGWVIPRGITFTPDSKFAYIANMGGDSLTLIDVKNGHIPIKEIYDVGRSPRHLVISPDGKYLYISNNVGATVRKLDLSSNKVEGVCKVGKNPRTIDISPDGKYLFSVNYGSKSVSVINTDTMKVVLTKGTGNKPIGVTITPDGKELWVSHYAENYVSVFEIEKKPETRIQEAKAKGQKLEIREQLKTRESDLNRLFEN